MHACVTYSHVGSWYVMEQPEPPLAVKIGFLFWQGHLQAFFMGLLFYLAGVFAHNSFERRGPMRFLRERAVRLCLPALLYMLALDPLIVFVILRRNGATSMAQNYVKYVTSGRFLSGNGPLWFALALFVLSVFFALWRRWPTRDLQPPPPAPGATKGGFRKSSPRSSRREEAHFSSNQTNQSLLTSAATNFESAPEATRLAIFALLLVLASFLVRTVQPIGANVMNFQLCFFVQYIAAFAAGIATAKHGWLESLATSRRAQVAGWLGIVAGPLLLLSVLKLGGAPPERGPNPYAGGWQPQALGLALWEQLTGVALGLGMLALFRSYFTLSSPFSRWLSDRSFAVYVLHAPVLVALTLWLRPIPGNPLAKMLMLTCLGLVASYLAADVAKRVPGLRSLL